MDQGPGNFDNFRFFWRSFIPHNPPLQICVDAVWHEIVWRVHTKHLKQQFGLVSWLVWWFFVVIRSLFKSTPFQPIIHTENPVFAFLATPAHRSTLDPVVREFSDISFSKVTSHGQFVDGADVFSVPEHAPDVDTAISLLKSTLQGVAIAEKYLMSYGCDMGIRLKGRLAARIYECLNVINWSEKLNKPTAPLLLTYELLPWQKGLVWHWRRSGQRVFHFMHGQRLDLYQQTMATDLVLFSKIDESWFRKRVDPSTRIWTVGHPRLEKIRKEVRPRREKIQSLPRVAFFFQPVEGDYSRELRLDDLRLMTELEGRAEVRLRAHPRENTDQIKADISEAGIEFAEVSEAGLEEDLGWCDAVASSWSTVSMEAAVCGRGIFWTCSTPERYPASAELRKHGLGVLITSGSDWVPYIEEFHNGGWNSPVVVADDKLRSLGMIGNMDKSWSERLNLN
ncbi:MAG: hypothetical protein AAF649_00340 [Verrucomicrobiota bacterium]